MCRSYISGAISNTMARARLSTAFTLERDGAGSVGASRIALLQAIHDHGSITAASARDPAMVERLSAVAGRVLQAGRRG